MFVTVLCDCVSNNIAVIPSRIKHSIATVKAARQAYSIKESNSHSANGTTVSYCMHG